MLCGLVTTTARHLIYYYKKVQKHLNYFKKLLQSGNLILMCAAFHKGVKKTCDKVIAVS